MTQAKILRPSRWQLLFFFLFSVACLFYAALHPDPSAWQWWLLPIIFGPFCVVFLALLVSRRGRLELSTEGFNRVNLIGSRFYRWEDCSRFECVRLRTHTFTRLHVIVFKAPPSQVQAGGPDQPGTKEVMLSSGYGMKIKALAHLLNQLREKRLDALHFPNAYRGPVSMATHGVSPHDRITTG